MDFWNEVTKTVSGAADQTVKSAEKLTEIAKLKYRLGLLKSKLEDSYRDLGRLRFSEFAGEAVTEEDYATLLARTAELTEQIRSCETRLADLQDYVTCASCGNRMKKGLNFCPKCGGKLSDK